jgi:anti-sigma factor RsiW
MIGRRKNELTCRELVELVSDYLDGSLSRRDRARFDAHIATCPHCTEYLEQFRQTIALTGVLREEDVPPAARDALLEQFAEWRREHA